jgi:hypothetical protein
LARQDYICNVLINGAEEEPENIEETIHMFEEVHLAQNTDPRTIFWDLSTLPETLPDIPLARQPSDLQSAIVSDSHHEAEEVPLVPMPRAAKIKSPIRSRGTSPRDKDV